MGPHLFSYGTSFSRHALRFWLDIFLRQKTQIFTFSMFLVVGRNPSHESVLEASKPDAVAAVDIASFHPVMQETAGEKFITARNQSVRFALFVDIKIAGDVARDEAGGNLLKRILPEWFAFGKGGF